MSGVGQTRKALTVLYERSFDDCSVSPGEPCGSHRMRRKSDPARFREVPLPALGKRYGEGRRVLFVGMNPGQYEATRDDYYTFFDPRNNAWEDRDFRRALLRMAEIAAGEPERAAWLNLVQCARDGDSTDPSERMWRACTPKSWKAIAMLEPDLLIALGKGVHGRLLDAAIGEGWRAHTPIAP